MRDEEYILNLCDEVLGERSERQKRFDFLKGDKGHRLPVDAYYPQLNLVIEYRERQHFEPVKFFDRRQTVSGVPRGQQRALYDQRRREELPKQGIRLVELSYLDFEHGPSKRLRRETLADREVIRQKLRAFLAEAFSENGPRLQPVFETGDQGGS